MITIKEAVEHIESDDTDIKFYNPSVHHTVIDCSKLKTCSDCFVQSICSSREIVGEDGEIMRYLFANKLHPELFL